ncbi:DUF2252 domain-containing protein [Paraburkholderia strydomiana]|uniref:Uncharacterized protein (DUF2252 family) n=1 Tax=Paraburkholderia caledonica TaxID=134536 RepID=A0ABU1KY59_9BURK|nr:DUF2252 domain-containing protein [Paraburkholderia caledonica]MDR6375923.1 uncharacterized protein (DUF2252 family) [Paraburkholderia caledonica]TCF97063.1 hypothetical protein BZM26_33915 [Paraburkholderia strydomiana]CAH2899502.1 MAG: Uncharacterized protein conserved in bacteria [uncultured Paraburkholderia sp.]CAH2926627.1 MAG: Uncharacterized protein conserved in bacteria [uncultured Paraburkholderia sp.]
MAKKPVATNKLSKPLSKRAKKLPEAEARQPLLTARRNARMARSAHAYVRGSTNRFYEWLDGIEGHALPEGPAVWICGDCHTGNLGPVADANGRVEIQIRDLDQTVIGNPAHDLIRLGLSLATAARGSDLPGVTIVQMMEALADGYERAFDESAGEADIHAEKPEAVRVVMKEAVRRSWRHLAEERIEDSEPTIPLGSRFWPLAKNERREIDELFSKTSVAALATALRGAGDEADVEVLDAAYWVKGCSSLGRLRYAVLLDIDGAAVDGDDLCLIDIKEAAPAAAPRYAGVRMPRDNAERVVEGARHLSPSLGDRMRSARLADRAVVIRELLPQDMKLTIEQLTRDEATKAARFLALVVGKAHARQMHLAERKAWLAELRKNRSKTLDAPGWLWKSIVQLVSSHAAGYLEHCRKYATGSDAA